MKKKLLDFVVQQGFTPDGNLAYGIVDDVYVTVSPVGNQTLFNFSMSCPTLTAEMPITATLKSTKIFGQLRVKQQSDCITVLMANAPKAFRPEAMKILVDTVVRVAKENNVLPNTNCSKCGKQTDAVALFRNSAVPMCKKCVDEVQRVNATYKVNPISYLTGFIGACLGAVIGSIPWIIALSAGWIVGYLAFIIGMGAFAGYKLFRGPKIKSFTLVSIYSTSLLTVLGVNVAVAVLFIVESGYSVSILNIISVLGLPDMIYNVIISLALSIGGIVGVNRKIGTYVLPNNAKVICQGSSDVRYDSEIL